MVLYGTTVDARRVVTLAAMPDKAASSAYLGLLRLLLYGGAYRECRRHLLSKDAIIGFSSQLEMLQVLMDDALPPPGTSLRPNLQGRRGHVHGGFPLRQRPVSQGVGA